jgi:ABC-type glycerol-3-phosphate transport system substrate-binding protein
MKKYTKLALIITLILTLSLAGCRKKPVQYQQALPPVTLNYYNVFEPEDNLRPLFTKFSQANSHITINYRNFNDLDRYLETIITELAEGRGPDIVSVPNTWIAQNYKTIAPAPSNFATPQAIREAFVQVVSDDNVFFDEDGIEKVFGIPLFVDTLAVYYNSNLMQQFVPEVGRPGDTWESMKTITERISLPDTDGNLIRSGLAIGTGKGILRSADIFNLMMLQKGANFYSDNFNQFNFASNNQAVEAVEFYNSFNNLRTGNPSWQDQLGSPNEKEIYAFATGKTAMIFGFSHLYDDILSTMELARRNGDTPINRRDILISEAPQFANATQKTFYANYRSQAVTRNSRHQDEAWRLITFLADPANLREYYKRKFRPTSRRELIPEQRENSTFAVFANQVGTAKSIPFFSQHRASEILREMLDQVSTSDQFRLRNSILQAQNELNRQIRPEGGFPPSRNIPTR